MLKLHRIATCPLFLALFASPFVACSPNTEAQAPAPAPVSEATPAADESPASNKPAPLDNSTAGVAQRHFKLLESGDLDALLADYAGSAFLLTPDGAVSGKEALSAHYGSLLKELEASDAALRLGDLRVRDEIAYITWSVETNDNKYELATDTFLIRNGKVVAQTFAARVVPKNDSGEESKTEEPPALEESPASAVLQRHIEAVKGGQVDAILDDYTIDSLILTQKGKKSGKEGVKSVFGDVSEQFKKPGLTFSVKNQIVQGEIAYVVWSAQTEDDQYGIITETFVIQNGKIASQTMALGIESKS